MRAMLDAMKVPHQVLPDSTDGARQAVQTAVEYMVQHSFAVLHLTVTMLARTSIADPTLCSFESKLSAPT